MKQLTCEMCGSTDLVKQEMEGAMHLSVKLLVEVGTGRSWYDAK